MRQLLQRLLPRTRKYVKLQDQMLRVYMDDFNQVRSGQGFLKQSCRQRLR
jgi:hypothetical protein